MVWFVLSVALGGLVLLGLATLGLVRLGLRPIWATGLMLGLAVVVSVYALWVEPRRLEVRRITLEVEGLAAPLRVVAIGDPQPNGFHWPPERLRLAFDRAQAERPDLVLWLGDYVYEPGRAHRWLPNGAEMVDPAAIAAEMGRLDAPLGAFAVLGNHDWWWNGPKVRALLEAEGVTVLIDGARRVEHPQSGAALWVAGLDDISTPRPFDLAATLGETDASAPLLILTHSPDAFAAIVAARPGAALTLAGHTHGGQINLPLIGRPVLPIARSELAYGLVEECGERLFVTAGVGTAVLPLRLNQPPEILSLDLVPAGAAGDAPPATPTPLGCRE